MKVNTVSIPLYSNASKGEWVLASDWKETRISTIAIYSDSAWAYFAKDMGLSLIETDLVMVEQHLVINEYLVLNETWGAIHLSTQADVEQKERHSFEKPFYKRHMNRYFRQRDLGLALMAGWMWAERVKAEFKSGSLF